MLYCVSPPERSSAKLATHVRGTRSQSCTRVRVKDAAASDRSCVITGGVPKPVANS